MNEACFKLAEGLVPTSYARQAKEARRARESLVKSLLAQRRLPDNGLDEGTLRLLLQEMALLDSNTFIGNAGVGEREGRVICPLVASRHFGLAHGVGRSGGVQGDSRAAARPMLRRHSAPSLKFHSSACPTPSASASRCVSSRSPTTSAQSCRRRSASAARSRRCTPVPTGCARCPT